MGTLADFRRQYPQYDDMSDNDLADALYRKHYSDLPREDVFQRMGVQPTAPSTDTTPRTDLSERYAELDAEEARIRSQLEATDPEKQSALARGQAGLAGIRARSLLSERLNAIEDERRAMAGTGREVAQLSTSESLASVGKALPRTAIETVFDVAGSLGAAGLAGDIPIAGVPQQLANKALTALVPDLSQRGEEVARAVSEAGEDVTEALGLAQTEREKEALQYQPALRYTTEISGGVGSTLPFLATGGIGAGARLASLRGATSALLSGALGTGVGATEARERMDQYEQETGEKLSPEIRERVTGVGSVIGLSEILPVGAMLNRAPAPVKGAITRNLIDPIMRSAASRTIAPEAARAALRTGFSRIESSALGRLATRGFLPEAAQEGSSQFLQNVLEGTYDPTQSYFEGVPESALLGGIVGGTIRGGVEGITSAAAYRQRKALRADAELRRTVQGGVDDISGVTRPATNAEKIQAIRDSNDPDLVDVQGDEAPLATFTLQEQDKQDPSKMVTYDVEVLKEADGRISYRKQGESQLRKLDVDAFESRLVNPEDAFTTPDGFAAADVEERVKSALPKVKTKDDAGLNRYVAAVSGNISKNLSANNPREASKYVAKMEKRFSEEERAKEGFERDPKLRILDEARSIVQDFQVAFGQEKAKPAAKIGKAAPSKRGTLVDMIRRNTQARKAERGERDALLLEAQNEARPDVWFQQQLEDRGFLGTTTQEAMVLRDYYRVRSQEESARLEGEGAAAREETLRRWGIIEQVLADPNVSNNRKVDRINEALESEGMGALTEEELATTHGAAIAEDVFGPGGVMDEARREVLDEVLADDTVAPDDKVREFSDRLEANPALRGLPPTEEEVNTLIGTPNIEEEIEQDVTSPEAQEALARARRRAELLNNSKDVPTLNRNMATMVKEGLISAEESEGVREEMRGAPAEAPKKPAAKKPEKLTVKSVKQRRTVDQGTFYEVELSDGRVATIYRDTDQFGPSNPVWHIDSESVGVAQSALPAMNMPTRLGSTKTEALEALPEWVESNAPKLRTPPPPPQPETKFEVGFAALRDVVKSRNGRDAGVVNADLEQYAAGRIGRAPVRAVPAGPRLGREGVRPDGDDSGVGGIDAALEEAPAVEEAAVEEAPAIEEPPVPEGMVRVYHSGSRGEGQSSRWVSTDRTYASNYRADLPLFYFDIPKSDPRVEPAYPEQSVERGFTFNFELAPEEAAQLVKIRRQEPKVEEAVVEEAPAVEETAVEEEAPVAEAPAVEALVADQPGYNKPTRTAIYEAFLAPVARRLKRALTGVKERTYNKYAAVKDIYQKELDAQLLEQFGVDVSQLPPDANLAKVFKLFESSKRGRQLLVMRNKVYKITDKLKELEVDPQDVGMYLWARAVKDRNALVGKRDTGNPDNGAGMTNAEAREVLETLAEKDDGKLWPKLQEIAKMHDALVDFNLKVRVDAGILSKKQAAAFKKTQPYYAALKGWAEAGDMQSFGEMNSVEDALNLEGGLYSRQGDVRNKNTQLGVKPKEFLKSQGRASMPFNPLFNLFADTANVVANATQNEVGRKLLQIYREYPEAHEGIITVYNEAEGKKKFKISDDLTTPEGTWAKVDLPNEVRNGNMLLVKDNGENFFVEFAATDSGRALKRSFSNMKPVYYKGIIIGLDQIIRGWIKATQAFKSALTRYNPSYIPVAYLRDTMDALVTAKVTQGLTNSPASDKKLAGKIAAHVLPVFGTPHVRTSLVNWMRGKPPANEMEAMLMKQLEDMIYYGGSVGHANVMEVETYAKQIERQIKAQGSGNPVLRGAQAVEAIGAALDGAAQFVDLQARFATYLAARQEGISEQDAAELALDSSLDLTQRGTLAPILDQLIPFFSPAVGGTAKILRFTTSKSGRKMLGSMVLIGALLSLWNQWMGGDDDDGDGESNYDEIDEYVKQSNFILFYGRGAEDYVRVPTGFMVGLPQYIGTVMSETGVKAAQDPARTPTLIGNAAARAGVGTFEATSPIRSFFGVFGVAQPVVETYRNENYFNDPIYNEAGQYDTRLRSDMGRAGTAQFWKNLARGISDMTGGTSVQGGSIGIGDLGVSTDIQPEIYRHLFKSYATIGPGDFLWRVTSTATNYNPDQTLAQQLPVVRRFTSAPTDYNTMSEFYENTEGSLVTPSMEAIMAGVRDSGLRAVQEDYEGSSNEYRTDREYVAAYSAAKSRLDAIYRARRQQLDRADTPEQREAIIEYYDPMIRDTQQRANMRFREIKQYYERN